MRIKQPPRGYLAQLEAGVVLLVFIFSFDFPFNEKDIYKQASKHSKYDIRFQTIKQGYSLTIGAGRTILPGNALVFIINQFVGFAIIGQVIVFTDIHIQIVVAVLCGKF